MSKYRIKFTQNNNPQWNNDEIYNSMFLNCQTAYLNEVLKADGIIFMKEVLKAYGFFVKDIDQEILKRYWIYSSDNAEINVQITPIADGYDICFETEE